MFGKKARKIKGLTEQIGQMDFEIDALKVANADKDQKLLNAQALIQRAEAGRDAQKRRADENYAQYRACQKDFDDLKALHTNAVAAKKSKK